MSQWDHSTKYAGNWEESGCWLQIISIIRRHYFRFDQWFPHATDRSVAGRQSLDGPLTKGVYRSASTATELYNPVILQGWTLVSRTEASQHHSHAYGKMGFKVSRRVASVVPFVHCWLTAVLVICALYIFCEIIFVMF